MVSITKTRDLYAQLSSSVGLCLNIISLTEEVFFRQSGLVRILYIH